MSDEIELDEAGEGYRINGGFFPRVTTILARLNDFSGIDPATLGFARTRGTAVHQATSLDDQGLLDEDSLDERVRPYVDAWRRFKSDTGLEILENEKTVYSVRYQYAGTLDRVIKFNGRLWVIDLKSGAVPKSSGPQLAAYGACVPLYSDVPRRAAVHLAPRLNPPYRLITYRDKSDFSVFLACLTLYNWERRND